MLPPAAPRRAASRMRRGARWTRRPRRSSACRFPLRAQHGGRPPAEQPAFDALGDLDERDGEDHEDQKDQVYAFRVEQPGRDVQPITEPGRRADEFAHDHAREREAHARPQRGEDPAEHGWEHDETREVRAAAAHDLHHLHELRIDGADPEVRVEEDDEEDREEAQGDLRRDAEPEPRQQDRRDGRARMAGLTATKPSPRPPVTASHAANSATMSTVRRTASESVRFTRAAPTWRVGTRRAVTARSSSRARRTRVSRAARTRRVDAEARSGRWPSPRLAVATGRPRAARG